MPDQTGQTPRDDKSNTKKQANPWILVFFAIVAFAAGAPLVFPVFILFVALLVWRKQVALKNLRKMPPLPKKTQEKSGSSVLYKIQEALEKAEKELSPQRHTTSAEMPTGSPASDHWDISRTEPDKIILIPRQAQPTPEAPSEVAPLLTPNIDQQPEIGPEPIVSKPQASPVRHRMRSTREPALSFSNPAHLRQAFIAMAVLGPCRALEPYQGPEHAQNQTRPADTARDQPAR